MLDEFGKTLKRAIDLSNRASRRTGRQSERDMREAARLLRDLCSRLRGRTPLERWNVRRHYYRAIGQYRRVIALGHAEIARGNKSGVLSVGFGNLDCAHEQWKKGRMHRAAEHALAAEKAFRKLLKLESPRSNRCIALAYSLAMQGQFNEAEPFAKEAKRLGCSVGEWKQWEKELRALKTWYKAASPPDHRAR